KTRRRPDMADRHRIFRLPNAGRRIQSRRISKERFARKREDDRDKNITGRKTRPRRYSARVEKYGGDRRDPPRDPAYDGRFTSVAPDVLDGRGPDAVRQTASRPFGRETHRL